MLSDGNKNWGIFPEQQDYSSPGAPDGRFDTQSGLVLGKQHGHGSHSTSLKNNFHSWFWNEKYA